MVEDVLLMPIDYVALKIRIVLNDLCPGLQDGGRFFCKLTLFFNKNQYGCEKI